MSFTNTLSNSKENEQYLRIVAILIGYALQQIEKFLEIRIPVETTIHTKE